VGALDLVVALLPLLGIEPSREINCRKRQRISELVRDAAKGRMFPVLDLEPVLAAARLIAALAMLGHQPPSPMRQAASNSPGPISPCSNAPPHHV